VGDGWTNVMEEGRKLASLSESESESESGWGWEKVLNREGILCTSKRVF
jgi:hypothetical protein